MTDILSIENKSILAEIAPFSGANLIRLTHKRSGLEALRVPPDMATLAERPNVYGIPILFPPSRIDGGSFMFEGREYAFPINEPERGCSLHGALSGYAFETLSRREDSAVFRYRATAERPYLAFPHAFTLTLRYALCEDGVLQTLLLVNDSPSDMPFGLGFHTAFSAAPETRVWATVGREWALDKQRLLPTGKTRADTELTGLLTGGGLPACGGPVSALLTNIGGRAVLRTGDIDVVYDVDPALAFFFMWNGGGKSGFFCVEPQTWATNAPNLKRTDGGMCFLRPGEKCCLRSRISFDTNNM